MPNAIKRGTDEPLLQYTEAAWTLQQGGESFQEWKGISLAKMSAKANYFAGLGWNGRLRFEHDVATLNVYLGNAGGAAGIQEITDRWEVAVDQEKPELYQNEKLLALVQANDATSAGSTGVNLQSLQIIAAIKNAISGNNSSPALAWGDFITAMGKPYLAADGTTEIPGSHLSTGINLTGSAPNLKHFFTDLAIGRSNFLHGKYSLRHTTIAPSNYAANVADFNVEKIYTIAQLLTECQSVVLWILPIPGYLSYKIGVYPVPANMLPNYIFGALKMRSNAVLVARGRIEITTEYLIDACPLHTYGAI